MEVLAEGVISGQRGASARAPVLGILGRRVHQPDGQWGSVFAALRAPLGAAIYVSRGPRNRMGIRGSSRQHSRHQLQRNVYRITRPSVGRSWLYRAPGSGAPGQNGLLRQAHRAWQGHGRFGDPFRNASRTALSGSSGFSLQRRPLASFYTSNDAADFPIPRGTLRRARSFLV